jgi:hypothetical protein
MPKNEASHSNLTTLFLLRKPEASTIKVKAISLPEAALFKESSKNLIPLFYCLTLVSLRAKRVAGQGK